MDQNAQYEPSPRDHVRAQVEEYEASGGARANTLRDTGYPIVVVTLPGRLTGKIRKVPLMRVEHNGEYALVGSRGGAPQHPLWVHNLRAAPGTIWLQDGPVPFEATVREVTGDERAIWWERAVAAYPHYGEYQTRTEREIPVFVVTPC